jgi:hypothetical protein
MGQAVGVIQKFCDLELLDSYRQNRQQLIIRKYNRSHHNAQNRMNQWIKQLSEAT